MEFAGKSSVQFIAFAYDRSWEKRRFVMAWRMLSEHRTLKAAQAECGRYARALAKWEGA
jgi:hypothetical protein